MKLTASSIKNLSGCDKRIQNVVLKVAIKRNICVIEGARSLERQEMLFKLKKTKTMNSKHLITKDRKNSFAVDLAPVKDDGTIDWNDTKAFHDLAKEILDEAKLQNVDLRWGGDWDRDGETEDEKFRDLVHFELV